MNGASTVPLTEISVRVRNFYDQHPYPPAIESLEEYQRHWDNQQRRRADFHLFWPGRRYRKNQSILIAGCGTSQAAKHALRWPEAQIIGIDSSATSVHCTEQLKKKHNLMNLEVRTLAIEDVSELGMSFDQIVCTGVLHHLGDPEEGLTALRGVLKREGAMQLMVYAPYGRAGIYMLQDFCRRLGIEANSRAIRDLSRALCALPSAHPLQNILMQSPELRNEKTIADALLHPQDRAYSVPQFFDLIGKSGLAFGRWLRQAAYSVHCGVVAKIPQSSAIARLPVPEQYAAIELFRGTMIRHSAIVYRDDCDSSMYAINFNGDAWLDYVPLRMPDTLCVQEGVPAGAAAVLLNRTHTYKDLLLIISPAEKKLLDAIDGQRSIAEIVQRALVTAGKVPHWDDIRAFFERLWWHDQVVFCTATES